MQDVETDATAIGCKNGIGQEVIHVDCHCCQKDQPVSFPGFFVVPIRNRPDEDKVQEVMDKCLEHWESSGCKNKKSWGFVVFNEKSNQKQPLGADRGSLSPSGCLMRVLQFPGRCPRLCSFRLSASNVVISFYQNELHGLSSPWKKEQE